MMYQKLGSTQVRKIVDVRLSEIQKRLDDNGKNMQLDVDHRAKKWLADAGISPVYGARPLARVIQNELLVPLSKMIINESIREGEVARITCDEKANRLVVLPNHKARVNVDADMNGEGDVEMLDEPEIEEVQ